MDQVRDRSPVDMAISLLRAVGDDRGKYETLMGYIDGLNAGIRIAREEKDGKLDSKEE